MVVGDHSLFFTSTVHMSLICISSQDVIDVRLYHLNFYGESFVCKEGLIGWSGAVSHDSDVEKA